MTADRIIIKCSKLKRTYPPTVPGEDPLELVFPDLEIEAGERVALLGLSGSGKSTFLNLLAGLDFPDAKASIKYTFADGSWADIADRRKPFPRKRLGFVFQEGHLISDASAGINAALPRLLNGIPGADGDLQKYMDALGLPRGAAGREAWRLSGGQKQRVAILRALFHCPQIIFADEPTSNLDRPTAEAIMRLLCEYQQQDPQRTLIWATHDLTLAVKFATTFFVIGKRKNGAPQFNGPLQNDNGNSNILHSLEQQVYDGFDRSAVTLNIGTIPVGRGGREIGYTQAKVGSSLTFAKRSTPDSMAQIGRFGSWMGSIEASAPPVFAALGKIVSLYGRRFSDHAVAGALALSILMCGLVFLGLRMTEAMRKEALSDPLACHVVAGAPDATIQGANNVELSPSFIKGMNDDAPWRSQKSWFSSLVDYSSSSQNPCGETAQLVFGRNITVLELGVEKAGQCAALGLSPKTLVANLAEPAISSAVRVILADSTSQQVIGQLLPNMGFGLQNLSLIQQQMRDRQRTSFTGNELLISEEFSKHLKTAVGSDQFYGTPFCLSGRSDSGPLYIGGVIKSGLPQPRATPYDALLSRSSFFSAQSDIYDQAVFYTHPEQANVLEKYLTARGFAFSREEVQRMIAASQRFTAISLLIIVVGISMIISAFFFLFTCIEAFMEKNSRPSAVLRGYGLTRNMLCRQIMWRLAAVVPYSMWILFWSVGILGIPFWVLSPTIGLPLPSLTDLVLVSTEGMTATAIGIVVTVQGSVWLWWRKHRNVAQELN